MKKTAIALLSTPILITLLILGMTPEASATGNRDALILTCAPGGADPAMGGPLQVVDVSRSEGANDVPIMVADPMDPMSMGAICAQAVADLLNAGFDISGQGQGGAFGTLAYTMTRTGRP